MIGRDPWDPHCWSSSGYNLFTLLKKQGYLEDAFGVEATKLEYLVLAIKNFNISKIYGEENYT